MKVRRQRLLVNIAVLLILFFLSMAGCTRTPGESSAPETETDAGAPQEEVPMPDPVLRGTDVETPGEGCVFLELEGTFETPDPEKILARLNEIRLEACREGYMNPATGEPLTEADYVPLAWSADLEKTARLRAAEACVVEDHMRPNGGDCFSVAFGGQQANYETLAWGYAGILESVEGWYSEKEAYTEETGGVASHYIALITPGNRWVGAAAFAPADEMRTACAAEFAMEPGPAQEQEEDPYGPCRQIIEVREELLSE